MSSAEFYDNYLSYHIRSGINDRIYFLYKRLKKIGLDKSDKVLEIGCGIGALTFLLSKIITTGKIEAIDISPRSIAFAQEHIKSKQVFFLTQDVLNFIPSSTSFDKILLFDVLEHIPADDHPAVFSHIASWLKQDGYLLINLPNPEYILYDQKNNPEALQELDQPVYLEQLLPILTKCSLELLLFEALSVWVKNDYHLLMLRKKQEFKEEFLSAERSLLEKGLLKFARISRKIKYRFP